MSAEAIDLFLKSDAGCLLGIILFILGASDISCGWYVFRYRPDLLPIPQHAQDRMMLLLFFAASFMLLTGLYILSFHLTGV